MSRILFYISAVFTTVLLILIIVLNPPKGEMKGIYWALAGSALTTIAMAIESRKKKNQNK